MKEVEQQVYNQVSGQVYNQVSGQARRATELLAEYHVYGPVDRRVWHQVGKQVDWQVEEYLYSDIALVKHSDRI